MTSKQSRIFIAFVKRWGPNVRSHHRNIRALRWSRSHTTRSII